MAQAGAGRRGSPACLGGSLNVILFAEGELPLLPRRDARAVHILEVLRCRPGDSFAAGIVNGDAGRATLVSVEDDALVLEFAPGAALPGLEPLSLIVGLARPQTAKKVLQEASSLGVCRIQFVHCELAEKSYAHSPLWTREEWRRHVFDGAQQAVTTRLPEVTVGRRLREALKYAEEPCKVGLDNARGAQSLSVLPLALPVALAIGPERGWSDGERAMLQEYGFSAAHLGSRVLRVETAVVAALSIVRSRCGLM